MTENRREFFRILYPADERPVLHVGGMHHPVRDCSERGLSFMRQPTESYTPGEMLSARIEFASGESSEVSGRVVRVFDDMVAVELVNVGVPFGVILAEQRRLYAQRRRPQP